MIQNSKRERKSFENYLNQSGSGLTLGLIVTATILAFSAGIMQRTILEGRYTNNSYSSISALNVAEAGLEETISELNHNTTLKGNFKTPSGSWSDDVNGKRIKQTASITNTGGVVVGEYDVSVTNPASNNPIFDVTGYVPNKASFKAKRTVSLTLTQRQAQGCTDNCYRFAALGDIGMDFNNATSDSYDSSKGLYNAVVNGVNNISNKGHIGNNSTANNKFTVASGAVIAGKLFCGYGCADPNTVINSATTNHGGKFQYSEPTPLPSIAQPTGLTTKTDINTGSGATVNISGDGSYSLIKMGSNGTLNFTQNATIYVADLDIYGGASGGTARINVLNNAKVTIYVGNSMSIGSKTIVNENGVPSNFTIKATDTFTGYDSSGIRIYGDGKFYGTVIAKNAGINIGSNTEVFGAIAASKISISGGAKMHFDEKLMPNAGGGSLVYVADNPSTWEYYVSSSTWVEKQSL